MEVWREGKTIQDKLAIRHFIALSIIYKKKLQTFITSITLFNAYLYGFLLQSGCENSKKDPLEFCKGDRFCLKDIKFTMKTEGDQFPGH